MNHRVSRIVSPLSISESLRGALSEGSDFNPIYRPKDGCMDTASLLLKPLVAILLFSNMDYYAIQVRTRAEEKYMKLFSARNPEALVRFIFPKKKMKIRRAGTVLDVVTPIFPGYIFVESEFSMPYSLYAKLRRTDGFFRFLKRGEAIRPLEGRDLDIINHFVRTGPVAGASQVHFDENDRIVVDEGPLKGLEGSIVKVDKRKGRAKVQLDLYEESFLIDFAFEIIRRS